MKKTISILLAFLIVAAAFAGCSEKEDTEDSTVPVSSDVYVFADSLGRKISVDNPKRVACLLGSFADMWLLAGGEICASADDLWDDFGRDTDAVNLGSAHKINVEALLSAEPDFIIASSKLKGHMELKDTFEKAGIPAAFFDAGNFEAYLNVLKIMTDILDTPENYEKYGTSQDKKISELLLSRENEKEQTVLTLRASAGSIRVKNSEGTMLGEMLRDFGCSNIADSDTMLLEDMNIESIMKLNPDKIFFVETGDDIEGIKENTEKLFRENPLWGRLDAVKNGKVYYMDKHLYNLKPNARFFEAYEKLEKILYEE